MWKPEISVESGVVMITLGAEFQVIDQTVIGQCRRLWRDVKDRNACKVVLDLSATNYMDSEFLGMVFELRNSIVERPGGQMGICGLLPHPREVFALTKLDTLVDIFETIEEALAAYSPVDQPELEHSLVLC